MSEKKKYIGTGKLHILVFPNVVAQLVKNPFAMQKTWV